MSICILVYDSWPPTLQYQLPALLFVCVLFVLFLRLMLFCLVDTAESVARVGRSQTGSSTPPPTPIFIAGRPKAALLFWLFGGFRRGFFIVMFLLLDIKIGSR